MNNKLPAFSAFIAKRREELELSTRRVCELTESPFVASPIKSPIYLSRLERNITEHVDAAKVSADKLWALGIALKVNPLQLFALSRNMDEKLIEWPFAIKDTDHQMFGKFLHDRRKELKFTFKDIENQSKTDARIPDSISSSYFSQIEADFRGQSSKVEADRFWSIGVVLDVDPLLLYVLSRNLDSKLLSSKNRDNLFL